MSSCPGRTGEAHHRAVGDGAVEGDDCRGGAATMYCSPRSCWSDVVLDRKTSACQPVR